MTRQQSEESGALARGSSLQARTAILLGCRADDVGTDLSLAQARSWNLVPRGTPSSASPILNGLGAAATGAWEPEPGYARSVSSDRDQTLGFGEAVGAFVSGFFIWGVIERGGAVIAGVGLLCSSFVAAPLGRDLGRALFVVAVLYALAWGAYAVSAASRISHEADPPPPLLRPSVPAAREQAKAPAKEPDAAATSSPSPPPSPAPQQASVAQPPTMDEMAEWDWSLSPEHNWADLAHHEEAIHTCPHCGGSSVCDTKHGWDELIYARCSLCGRIAIWA